MWQALTRLAAFGLQTRHHLVVRRLFMRLRKGPALTRGLVRRLLRHAVAMRVFKGPEPVKVAHTKMSTVMTVHSSILGIARAE